MSNFQSRFPKYTREVYSMRTLKAYSELIQHPLVHLQIFYDPSDPASPDLLRGLQSIDSPAFHTFTSIELFPLGIADPNPNLGIADPNLGIADPNPNLGIADPNPNPGIADPNPNPNPNLGIADPNPGIADLDRLSKDQQRLRRTALCAILELPAERAIHLQLCLLHSEGSAESVIKACSTQWNVFRLSLEKCAESKWVENYAQNMTMRAKQAVYERSQSRVLFDLAASAAEEEEEEEEDLVLEAEADQDGEEVEMEVEVEMEGQMIEKEASQMLKEMMPVTFLVNGKPLHDSELLAAALCSAVSPSQPLVCQKRKAIGSLRSRPTAVNLTVYVNTNCNNNIDALSPLMNWILSDPQCVSLVLVSRVGSSTKSPWGSIL